jgi:small subunit ribosomal protein S9
MEKQYIFAVGRRNRSTVNVKLYPNGSGKYTITKPNGSEITIKEYFGGNEYLYENAIYPFLAVGKNALDTYDADIEVSWGWPKGQSDSIKLAFARSLIIENPDIRPTLKPFGLLKRDPRRKERVKPGLRGARRRPQWSKR